LLILTFGIKVKGDKWRVVHALPSMSMAVVGANHACRREDTAGGGEGGVGRSGELTTTDEDQLQ
jgi:hypothetical protein